MLKKLAVIAAITGCLCSVGKANLIDLTPGGFDVNHAPEAFFKQFILREASREIAFFDEATPQGWVSQFGHLDGGTYFFTDLIGGGGLTANVSWDFSNLPGWSMSRILIFGWDANGTAWDNLYAVGAGLRFMDSGDLVALHDGVDIFGIAFYGRTPDSRVPDTGSTLALFGAGLLGLLLMRKRILLAGAICIVLGASVMAQDYWIYNGDGSISWITHQPNGNYTIYNGNGSITTIVPSGDRDRCEAPRHRNSIVDDYTDYIKNFHPGELPNE